MSAPGPERTSFFQLLSECPSLTAMLAIPMKTRWQHNVSLHLTPVKELRVEFHEPRTWRNGWLFPRTVETYWVSMGSLGFQLSDTAP